MGGGSLPSPSASGPLRRGFVQIRDLWHWDRLVQNEEDDVYEERWEGFVWLVWYIGRFKDEWLFPPAVTNVAEAREELTLLVSHQEAAQVYRAAFMVWRGKRSLSLDRLIEVAEYLEKTSRDVDIANLSGSVTCVAGGILSLIGIILAFFTLGASLGVTAAGTALAIGGAVTSTGAVIADGAITNSQNKVVDAIMEEDKRASQKLNGVLERIGVTSDRLDIWAQEHPQSVSPRTRDVLDRVRVMCGVFCTIRKIKRFSAAAKESLSAVKAAGRVIHATDECVTFTSHSGEGAMSAGAVLSMADDAVLAGGRQGARLAGSGSRAAASEAAAISSGAIVLNTLAMAVDIGMIAYLSYRIHNGSESERAKDIRSKVSLLEREKRALREVYECCEKFL